MAEDKKKVTPGEEKAESKVDSSQGLKRTVSGISGTKTLRVGRVNKKAKKPPTEEGTEAPVKAEEPKVQEAPVEAPAAPAADRRRRNDTRPAPGSCGSPRRPD